MKIDCNKLKQITWYRQESQNTPYLALGPCTQVAKEFPRPHDLFVYFTPRTFRGYFDEGNFLDESQKFFASYKRDRAFLKKEYKKWLTRIVPIEKEIQRIRKLDMHEISDKELLRINKKMGLYATRFWGYAFYFDAFDPHTDTVIEDEVFSDGVHSTTKELHMLLKPDALLSNQNYERAILLAISKHEINKKARERLADEFYYLHCSYASGVSLSERQVNQDIAHEKKVNVTQRLKELSRYQAATKRQKSKIYKKYKMSAWQKDVFRFFAFLTLWRDERKVVVQKMNNVIHALGHEIARRSNTPWKELRLCIPQYIDSIPVSKRTLKYFERLHKKSFLFAYDAKKRAMDFFPKEICNKIMRYVEPRTGITQTIHGHVACTGMEEGSVKVVLDEDDFKNFRAGDILVTVMTRPEFVPLMKKARAIITDEGGVTCHAAIISRELKKPCLIGTRIATRVLKNGERVVVDANQGVIRRVN